MEAAEKIPKKLYVYLDTTRGLRHRYGGEDVHRGRAGHYLLDTGIGDLRRDPDAVEMIGGGKIAYLNRTPLTWGCLGGSVRRIHLS